MIRQAVGNDVVDLDEPAIAESHFRERFLARVCAESERKALVAAENPKQLLWSLFAAKEAAFKVVCKLGPRPVFAHRKFVVADDLESVRWDAHLLRLKVTTGVGWVHAVAWTEGTPLRAKVAQCRPDEDPSVAARDFLLRYLELMDTVVVREPIPGSWDGFGPPRLVREGDPVGVDISLSHDRRFIAFAALGEGEP